MKFVPFNKNILLELKAAEEQKQGMLIVPSAPKQHIFSVKAVSEHVSIDVKEGDDVIIQQHHGFEIELDGRKYRVVDQSSIAGVLHA